MTDYDIKCNCEGPFQMTDIETVSIRTIVQGAVQAAYSDAFRRETHDWAYGTWKG